MIVPTWWRGALVGLALVSAATAPEKKPVPLYTNEDLDRVSPYRDQTGVRSEPAVRAAEIPPPDTPRAHASQGEAYWRREAARVRERVGALGDRADEIRRELREARSAPRSRRASGPSLATREARLAALERRMRELESALEDRARRAGALPGWLR